jgi:predicted nicotinamide N-methyase
MLARLGESISDVVSAAMDRSRDLEALLSEVKDKPGAMVALARLLGSGERRTLAVELCLRAVELAPGDEEVRVAAAEILASGVPPWHFDIVRDHGRNTAYEAALRRAITPGCKVLEIGTGTGLLAMMAARAGAAQVITCEADPAIASVARDIIRRNGFADRIRVVGKHSTALEVEGDLGGPVDVLVSEIVSNDLLSEGALPVMEHVREAGLLRPGGRMVPLRGRIRIALASDDDWQTERMSEAAGFDLTPFNQLAAPQRAIYVGGPRLTLRSEPVDLFAFDFGGGGPFPEARAAVALAAQGGRVNGVAQWIALDLDGEGRYENFPEPGAASSWMTNFHPFERELQAEAGQRFTVHGRHDRKSLRLWCG